VDVLSLTPAAREALGENCAIAGTWPRPSEVRKRDVPSEDLACFLAHFFGRGSLWRARRRRRGEQRKRSVVIFFMGGKPIGPPRGGKIS
jgi:hypothetical protein